MAYSPEQLKQIAASQGGGFQLYNMAQSGAVDMATLQAALGTDAVNHWLATNNLKAPTTTPTPAAPVTPTMLPPGTTIPPGTTPTAPTTPTTPTTGGQFGQGPVFNTQVPGNTTQSTDYAGYPTPIPTSPDYTAAANQQGQANLDAAKSTVALSNPNQINPFGSQTYTIGPDGRPVQTQSFSSDMQRRLNDLDSILPSVTRNIREQTTRPISQYDFQNIMDVDNVALPERQTQTGEAGISQVAEALRAREQPRLNAKRQQLESQLLARGFNPGTEGWNEAIDDFSRAENDFNLGLTSLAGQEQSRLFNLDTENRNTRRAELNDQFDAQMRKRQGEISDQVLARTLPIQEYASLVQAMTPTMPQFNQYQGTTVEANPIFDATTAKGIFDLGRYGTSIQGELGTRGIDAQKGSDLFGNVLRMFGL